MPDDDILNDDYIAQRSAKRLGRIGIGLLALGICGLSYGVLSHMGLGDAQKQMDGFEARLVQQESESDALSAQMQASENPILSGYDDKLNAIEDKAKVGQGVVRREYQRRIDVCKDGRLFGGLGGILLALLGIGGIVAGRRKSGRHDS